MAASDVLSTICLIEFNWLLFELLSSGFESLLLNPISKNGTNTNSESSYLKMSCSAAVPTPRVSITGGKVLTNVFSNLK